MTDARGNPVSTASGEALGHAEQALWRMMAFYDVPLPDLDAAAAADPDWALPRLMRAGFLLSLTEPGLVAEAVTLLQSVDPADSRLTARERAHRQALQALADGRWQAAVQTWDALLIDHPRDALALQWAHLWDFYRGDLAGLRGRPARALTAWDEADRLYPCVLALHAFGLEENHLHAAAEDAGRRALAIDPRVPWAIHAVAHVMEMQGRFEEGSAWLRQHQPAWAEGNGFAAHLWWHSALFRLEGLDLGGVLRLVDIHRAGDALQITLQRVDAAAMLWRLHLLGSDVAARCQALHAGWPLDAGAAGYYAFNDVHALLPMLAGGDLAAAEAWIARCAEQALAADGSRRSNHAMAREVGLPLMRGLLLLARGQGRACAELLYPARTAAQRLGGSHAQRDLIDQSLLAACVPRAGDAGWPRLGEALLRERLLAKPTTPLTRHWVAALG
jgi:tetratricopeptide (TPR) repeat protein